MIFIIHIVDNMEFIDSSNYCVGYNFDKKILKSTLLANSSSDTINS
jgi:hypothetical protein